MWFIASLLAMLCWSGSDFFNKAGTAPNDSRSHLKIGVAIGLVMGLYSLYCVTLGGVPFAFSDIIRYLPASVFYIASMILGYIGLRYIELSILSPICNSSGALVLLFSMLFFGVKWVDDDSDGVFLNTPIIIGVVLIVLGIMALGVVEYRENDEARELRQAKSGRKYTRSFLALLLPILYCLLDACGTFVDTVIADNYTADLLAKDPGLSEEAADLLCGDILNTAYGFTWLAMAVVFAIVLLIKREKFDPKYDSLKGAAGICETAGQLFYMVVVVSGQTVGLVIVSAYCALSMLWSRLFLKERLSFRHYAAIACAFVGIVILGIYDV